MTDSTNVEKNSGASYNLYGKPKIVHLEDGTPTLHVAFYLDGFSSAKHYAYAAKIMHHIEGNPVTTDARQFGDELRYMADSWIQIHHPAAAQTARDLANWYETRSGGDFTPPADADTDVIAAAKRSGAARERKAVVEFMREQEIFVTESDRRQLRQLRDSIERGDHLDGGDSDDA